MNVKYLRDVTRPLSMVGKKGDTKDLPNNVAKILLDGGYVEKVKLEVKKKL